MQIVMVPIMISLLVKLKLKSHLKNIMKIIIYWHLKIQRSVDLILMLQLALKEIQCLVYSMVLLIA